VADSKPQSQSGADTHADDDPRRSVARYLRRELDLGLEVFPARARQRAGPPPTEAPRPTPAPPRAGGSPDRITAAPPVLSADLLLEPAVRDSASLEELRAVLGDCSRCKLAAGRNHIVFGVGNPNADILFVGEGPGEDEDLQGIPFVGRAGGLLTDIITKGMGLAREDVYIANVIKCRPPNNRNPELDEIAACEPFLRRQVALVRPRVIVALGKFAAQVLLRSRVPISKLRGNWSQFDGVPLMPTFHPAYLLRTPSDKKLVWEDVKQVLEHLGLPIPQRAR
jgi:uracil-DNA glycosylase family 4